MKVLNILSTIIVSVLVVMVTMAVSDTNTNQNEEMSFTLSGNVNSGHPELSWNSVNGADYYRLWRTPTPSLGGIHAWKSFDLSGNYFLDSEVHGAELGPGLDQVRYTIAAYEYGGALVDSTGPVDYTADSIDY